MKIILKGTNLKLTQDIKDYVDDKIGGLDKYFDNILEARVELELDNRHHRKGDVYRCEVNLRIPKKILRVEKNERNINKAIDKVKDHLREEVLKIKGKLIKAQRREKARSKLNI